MSLRDKPYVLAVPVVGPTMRDALRAIDKAASSGADIAETRLDLIDRPDLRILLNCHPEIPKVATCRKKSQWGNYSGREKERIHLIGVATELGYQYVDIEGENLRGDFAKRESTLIGSGHYKFTPRCLVDIARGFVFHRADIVKLVTTPVNDDDVIYALQTVAKFKSDSNFYGKEIACFPVGERGIIGRVLSLVYGGIFTFGLLNGEKGSAPGQIPVSKLRDSVDRARELYALGKICPAGSLTEGHLKNYRNILGLN